MRVIRRDRHNAKRLYTPALVLLIFIVGTSFPGMGFVIPLRALYLVAALAPLLPGVAKLLTPVSVAAQAAEDMEISVPAVQSGL